MLPVRPSFFVFPDRRDQISAAFDYCMQEQIAYKGCFTVVRRASIDRIPYSDIIWFESRGRSVTLHSEQSTVTFNATLTRVESRLPKHYFLRIHQSYMVNRHHIAMLDRANRTIVMKTGETLSVSKAYLSDLVNKISIEAS